MCLNGWRVVTWDLPGCFPVESMFQTIGTLIDFGAAELLIAGNVTFVVTVRHLANIGRCCHVRAVMNFVPQPAVQVGENLWNSFSQVRQWYAAVSVGELPHVCRRLVTGRQEWCRGRIVMRKCVPVVG